MKKISYSWTHGITYLFAFLYAMCLMDIFLAVQVDDFFKQRLDLAAVAGLAKHPHNLCYDGFGGHVAGLKDARIVAVFFAYLVDLKVAAFFRDLRGNSESLS